MANRKGKRSEKLKNKGGRPSTLSLKLMETIGNLAMLGHTDAEICEVINVPPSTFSRWKTSSERFRNRLFDAREGARGRVARAMYERAIGYSVKSEQIVTFPKNEKVVRVPIIEHYPPDSKAGMSILKNTDPNRWKEKVEVEHKGLEGLAGRIAAARKRAVKKPENKRGEGQ